MNRLAHVRPDDPLAIDAATWNLLLDAAGWVREHGHRFARAGAGPAAADFFTPSVVVRVKNTTGSTLPPHAILTPTGAAVDPEDAPLEARRQPVVTAAAPSSADDPVVVLLDSIDGSGSDKLGRAVAAGVTVARVVVTDPAHRFARPDPGNLFALESAESGPAYLLTPPGVGTFLTLVLLGPPPRSGEAEPAAGHAGAAVAGLLTTDCLKLSVVRTSGACSGVASYQVLYLAWDAGDSRWESDGDFAHTGAGSPGPVHFWIEEGRPRLEIDAVELVGLGPDGAGRWHFSGGGTTLCGGSSTPCENYFQVAVECSECPVSTGTYTQLQVTPVSLPPGSTVVQFVVDGLDNGIAPTQLALDLSATGGLDQYTLTLTAPDGTTQYTLMSEPAAAAAALHALFQGTTAPSGTIDAVTQASGEVIGQFQADANFAAFSGNPNGVWTLTIANGGAGTGMLNSAQLTFGTPASPGTVTATGVSPTSGSSPLSVSANPTFSFLPFVVYVDWGDGSDVEFYRPGSLPAGHSLSATAEVVVRGYAATGGYAEDSEVVTVSVSPGTSCGTAAEIELDTEYGSTVVSPTPHWWWIDAPAGSYCFDSAGITAGSLTVNIYTGPDCGSLSLLASYTADATNEDLVSLDDGLWIEVINVSGSDAYTFTMHSGAC